MLMLMGGKGEGGREKGERGCTVQYTLYTLHSHGDTVTRRTRAMGLDGSPSMHSPTGPYLLLLFICSVYIYCHSLFTQNCRGEYLFPSPSLSSSHSPLLISISSLLSLLLLFSSSLSLARSGRGAGSSSGGPSPLWRATTKPGTTVAQRTGGEPGWALRGYHKYTCFTRHFCVVTQVD